LFSETLIYFIAFTDLLFDDPFDGTADFMVSCKKFLSYEELNENLMRLSAF